MDSKGKHCTVLQGKKWKCEELLFLANIIFNVLNQQLQGRDRMITDMYDAVKGFQVKLSLWKTQMSRCNLPHFLSNVEPSRHNDVPKCKLC